MLTEDAARRLPCGLLAGKVEVIPGYRCEASDCDCHWKPFDTPSALRRGDRLGDCYWLKQVREREGEE